MMALRDLTRQREIERAIRDSEQRFRSLSQRLRGNRDRRPGRDRRYNKTLAGKLGFDLAELVGMNVSKLVTLPSRAIVMEKLRHPSDRPWEVECPRKDGTTFPAEVRARGVPYQGRVMRVVAVRDMTELKRARKHCSRKSSV